MGVPDWRIGEGKAPVVPAGVTDLAGPGWTGRFERMTFGPGFHMHLGRVETTADVELPVGGAGETTTISVYTLVSGRVGLDLMDWPRIELAPGRTILFCARDRYGLFHIPGGQVVRFFSVAMAPALLVELLDRRIPAALAPLIDGCGRETVVRERAVGAATRALVEALGEPGEAGALQRLHREAVAVQLLTETVEAEVAGSAEAAPVLTPREEQAVRRARGRLIADLRDAPSAATLAEDADVGLRRFLRAFEALHGASPAQLLRRERLEAARRLLEAGDLPLKAIAWRVGYGHVSNFTAAFAEHFGAPPRRFQKRALAAE